MTVLENVMLASHFGMTMVPHDFDEVKNSNEIFWEILVGLEGMQGVIAKELTIANQKRLEVARALATKPELLLLDEFMAGLSPTEVIEAISFNSFDTRQRDLPFFMIEHVMKAIMGVSDRIIALHYGKKIGEGTPEEIAKNPKVVEVYLGT